MELGKRLKLGTVVKDTATGLKGMLTHMLMEMNGSRYYNFQPRGLDAKTGQPLETTWLVDSRIEGGTWTVDDKDWPISILGTEVEDTASGYKGLAVSMTLHINGCVHFDVQSKGLQETGAPVQTANFDYRRLKGKAVPKLTEEKLEASRKTKPSPEPVRSHLPSRPKM